VDSVVIFYKIPLEFAAEADKLLTLKLEGSVNEFKFSSLEIKDLRFRLMITKF
jgi:hypothetical protein